MGIGALIAGAVALVSSIPVSSVVAGVVSAVTGAVIAANSEPVKNALKFNRKIQQND